MFKNKNSFQLHILRRRRTWLGIIVSAFLIAVPISAWPSAQCAFGQCGPRDQWCNGDCSQSCQPATRLGIVVGCNPGVICTDDWRPNECSVRCSDSGNCEVTDLVSGGDCSGRLSGSRWNVMRCNRTPPCSSPVRRMSREDCCTSGSGGGGGGGGGGSCTPTYSPPTITLAGYTPPYPIVIGQDPEELGFDATIIATGGTKSNSCDTGPNQRNLTSLNLDSLALSGESTSWIAGELAQFYPGARILDFYPLHPDFQTNINGVNGALVFHHDPLDPGFYDARVTAVQDDGKKTTVVLQIPAHLLEATIVK